jgi:hypothetical protein
MNEYRRDQLRILLHRSLSQGSRKHPDEYGRIVYSPEDILQKIEYSINDHGYRSEKFDKTNEVLILGCSQTFGSGIPNELTWPDIFSNSISKKYSRLAMAGDSINGQVYKAFKYFEEIGNPEIVVALFPLYRLEYTIVPNKFVSSASWNQAETNKIGIGMAFFYEEYLTKISKHPHNPEYVIPREFAIFYNFMFIKMLEQYCESHNIKFIWSIYDDSDLLEVMQSMGKVSKNYLQTSDLENVSKYNPQKHEGCYSDFIDHKLYTWAADFNEKKRLGHWGIHTHQHMAERFLRRYKEIKND